MNQDNLTTVITSQGHAQDIPNLEQLSIPVDQLVAALDEVVTQPLSWREEKKDDDKDTKDADQQPQLLAAADTITVDIPMAPAEGSLQNIDTSYQSGYSGYDGGSEGLSPVAVFGIGLLAVVGIAAALDGGGSSSGGGGSNVNRPPVLDSLQSPISTDEDTSVNFTVSFNDPDGDDITPAFTTDKGGVVNAVAGSPGQYSYTPDEDFNGQETIQVEISDRNGGSDTASIVVNVAPVNDAPVAPTLSKQTARGQEVIIDATEGASDPEGDTLTYQLGTGPSNGSVNIIAGSPGQFEYIPNQGYSGTDSFTVTVSDGDASTTRTIQVQVGGNIAPEADAQQDVTLEEDTPTTIDIGAEDANGDTLSYEVTASPDNGSVESTGVPGEFEYTPNANFSGSDSFTVTVTDGNGGEVTQTVNLTITAVNDAPEADAFQNVTSPEGASVDIQVDATDVEGDTLSYTVVTDPANGTVTNNGGGNFTYTPTDGDFIGQDSFEVEISDGDGGTTTQEVRITVNADNDAPQVDETQDVSTESAAPVTITVSAADAEGDTLSYGAGAATNGSVVPGSAPGQFIYRPDAGFDGEDSFDVFVSDGNGGVSSQTVTVTVADSEGTEYDLTPLAGPALGLTDEADIVSGSVSDTGSTLNPGDTIDGQGGFDSLQISQSADFTGFGGANPLAQGSMDNVERLGIVNNAGGTSTFNATGASGLEYLFLDANDESFTFDSLSDTDLTFEIADADSINASGSSATPTLSYTLNFGGDTNDGENDSLTLILNDVGRRNPSQGQPDDGIEVIAADIEHLTVVAKSGQNYIDLQGITEVQSLTIGGAGDLDTSSFDGTGSAAPTPPVFSSLTTVDGSSALGDLTLALFSAPSAPMQSVSTGFGDDIVEAGSNIRSTTTLNGGDGDDLLLLSNIGLNGAPNNTVTLASTMTGFETVDLKVADNIDTFTFSAANITGLRTVQVSDEGINNPTLSNVTTTIRDLNGQALTLSFLENSGVEYQGSDTFIIQDSGDLTIATTSDNDNSPGSFADNIEAIAAPKVNLEVGRNTTFAGTITANAADSASLALAAGGTIDTATLRVTSADEITIDGADDTSITDLALQGNNVTSLTISGSVTIDGLAPSNLNNLQTLTSTSLGGTNLTDGGNGVGQFSEQVTVVAEDSVVGDFGLTLEIAAYAPTNGGASVAGSTSLSNDITIGAGRDQITVTGGSDDDRVTLGEVFEAGDGALIDISLGNGVNDTLTLADGDNVIESLTLSGVETVAAGAASNELQINASAVSGQVVAFSGFAQTTLYGTDGDDNIDLENVTGVNTVFGLGGDDVIIGTDGDDEIVGGAGADNMTGRLGNNTYVFNSGDIVAGETITFNASNTDTETLRVDSSTEFFLLNEGAALTLADEVLIADGQTASFRIGQLTGRSSTLTISGQNPSDETTLEIHGTSSAETIDLNALDIDLTTNTPALIINAGAGADVVVALNGVDNTYVYNTGDITAGETITFGSSTNNTFVVESTTNFSALNGGNSALTGLNVIELAEGTTATFNAAQLGGFNLTINGIGNNGGESLVINGNNTPETIDLSTLTFDTSSTELTLDSDDVTITVNAGSGDDTITGSSVNDVINGEGGLDRIIGGAGADTLSGGANSDTFVHNQGDGVGPTARADNGANGLTSGDELGFGNGVDTIENFADGEDLIELEIGGAQLSKALASEAFDVDLVDFGLKDDEYTVIRGDFVDSIFTVGDENTGSDLLLAFDANADDAGKNNPAIDSVDVEFILLSGAGGTVIDGTDFVV